MKRPPRKKTIKGLHTISHQTKRLGLRLYMAAYDLRRGLKAL